MWMEGVQAAMKTRHLEADQWLNRKEWCLGSGRRRQLSQDRKDRQIDKIYPHILCFSEHHMSKDDVHFVGIENYVLRSSFSRITFQKGGVCMYIHNYTFFK